MYLVLEITSSSTSLSIEPIDNSAQVKYALKRVLIQNNEQLRDVREEIQVHRKVSHHENIITLIDSEIIEYGISKQGENLRQAIILFPVYEKGTLLDYTLALQRGEVKHLTPKQVISLFMGICSALHMMHTEFQLAHRDIKPGNILLGGQFTPGVDDSSRYPKQSQNEDDDIEEEKEEYLETMALADESRTASAVSTTGRGLHGVLIDFGSCKTARTMITSRQDALTLQEDAERSCTAPYRSPELWDVPSECVVDEKVDIWSLGCTLYACIFGKSPFESAIEESGGSLMLAVLSGKIKWWDDGQKHDKSKTSMPYPEYVYFKTIIQKMIQVDSAARPSAEQVMMMLKKVDDVFGFYPNK